MSLFTPSSADQRDYPPQLQQFQKRCQRCDRTFIQPSNEQKKVFASELIDAYRVKLSNARRMDTANHREGKNPFQQYMSREIKSREEKDPSRIGLTQFIDRVSLEQELTETEETELCNQFNTARILMNTYCQACYTNSIRNLLASMSFQSKRDPLKFPESQTARVPAHFFTKRRISNGGGDTHAHMNTAPATSPNNVRIKHKSSDFGVSRMKQRSLYQTSYKTESPTSYRQKKLQQYSNPQFQHLPVGRQSSIQRVSTGSKHGQLVYSSSTNFNQKQHRYTDQKSSGGFLQPKIWEFKSGQIVNGRSSKRDNQRFLLSQ